MRERELKQKIERKKKGNFLFFQIREKHKKRKTKNREKRKIREKEEKNLGRIKGKGFILECLIFFAKERVQSLDGKEGRDLHFFSRERVHRLRYWWCTPYWMF